MLLFDVFAADKTDFVKKKKKIFLDIAEKLGTGKVINNYKDVEFKI